MSGETPNKKIEEDKAILTPEQLAKNEAMDAPLPIGEAFKAEMIKAEIEELDKKDTAEAKLEAEKLHKEVLEKYLDNYDKIVEEKMAPVRAQEALENQRVIDVRELADEFRDYNLNNLEGRDAAGFGKQYRAYLESEAYQNEPNKREARENWKKAFWTPEKIAEEQAKDRLAVEEREKAWLAGEAAKQAAKEASAKKGFWKRIFG